ncbi:MAG: hypothetical protein JW751_22250 [Polyangiaceae bacterium]|nr:hypothetical protein [Polyangiaceae bacterium]
MSRAVERRIDEAYGPGAGSEACPVAPVSVIPAVTEASRRDRPSARSPATAAAWASSARPNGPSAAGRAASAAIRSRRGAPAVARTSSSQAWSMAVASASGGRRSR